MPNRPALESGSGLLNHVDAPNDIVTLVSHCFGCGGLDLGLARVFGDRLRTIAACEIESYAVATSIKKVEDGKFGPEFPFWPDVKSFPFGAFRGLVDIYTCGFPCQPFSCAGAGKADLDPRHLWPWIRRGIERMVPAAVFLENVSAIITAKLKGNDWSDPAGTPVLLHVLRELERLGYRVTADIFSAEEVGAPHLRKRVFIYGELANGQGERGRGERINGSTQGRNRLEASGPELVRDRWPAGQGYSQHAWEPPRLIGSMDIDPNGLPAGLDRVDRLRLLGNAVVPATAAVAYQTLKEKLK